LECVESCKFATSVADDMMSSSAVSKWAEHRTPEGKVYYHNTETNETSWEKPDELKTGQERAVGAAQTAWKEFTAASGKKYFYNAETKVTTWEMPEELKAAVAATEALATGKTLAAAPAVAARPAGTVAPSAAPAVAPAAACAAAPAPAADGGPSAAAAPAAAPTLSATEEAAAAAAAAAAKKTFFAMLESAGVSGEASWEEAMKRIINKPEYRVLQTLAERKAAFFAWRELKREEREEEARRILRQRKVAFLEMLKGCAELSSRTRFHKVVQLFERDPRWSALDGDENEREELYEEYVDCHGPALHASARRMR